MALLYLDASACVKLLVDEDGSDLAAALWDAADAVLSSRLAYPEVRAALAAAHRGRRLTAPALRRTEHLWEGYWGDVRPVELTVEVARAAGEVAAPHGLRGADAVHLSSALALGRGDTIVATWDRRLHTGARQAGLAVAPAALD